MKNDSLSEIADRIKNAGSVLIFPHLNMDGDTMGSASALCMAIRHMGKTAYVMLDEAMPDNLDFLECGCTTEDQDIIAEPDIAIMVDCGGIKRIAGREGPFNRAKEHICIDHHGIVEEHTDFDFRRVEADSAATGEIVYMLIRELGCGMDLDMANSIFAAITTDTGNFQYSNTTKRSHEIAGELYDVEGFDSKKISALIYDRNSFASMKLSAMVIESVEFHENGAIAFGVVTQKDLSDTGCHMSETDGMIQRVMSIRGVETGVLFKESKDGKYKLSMRAKSFMNVGDIAFKFGGGGHAKAAGCTLDMPLDEAKRKIADAIRIEMETIENDPERSNKHK